MQLSTQDRGLTIYLALFGLVRLSGACLHRLWQGLAKPMTRGGVTGRCWAWATRPAHRAVSRTPCATIRRRPPSPTPSRGRPRQRRLAARPVDVAQRDRRRASESGQPAGGAGGLPRPPGHRQSPHQGRPRQCGLAARPRCCKIGSATCCGISHPGVAVASRRKRAA